MPSETSSVTVLPISVAPASSRRCTAHAWRVGIGCHRAQSGLPPPVGCPATSKRSLATKVRPESGPSAAPAMRSGGPATKGLVIEVAILASPRWGTIGRCPRSTGGSPPPPRPSPTPHPPNWAAAPARPGFPPTRIRLTATPSVGVPPYDMLHEGPLLRETLARLADTGVSVLDTEFLRFEPEHPVGIPEGFLEISARLGARHVLVMSAEPDEARTL